MAGNQIPNVSFRCSHGHSTSSFLTFSSLAFIDETGTCGLTGSFAIVECNVRQFYVSDLQNCHQLNKIAFIDSHVESIIDIPTLTNLQNITVYYPQVWNGAKQRGLSRFTLAREAKLPNLRYLDLTGNSLKDDSIEFLPELTTIEELYLETNFLNVVPELSNLTALHTFSVTLNGSVTDVSIQLPNPATPYSFLKANIYSSNTTKIYNVTSLQGSFTPSDSLYLDINFDEFNENVFLAPLKSGLRIYLNQDSRFQCGCKISWLIRDNRDLLPQVYNGICTDGRSFQSIDVEEVVCCLNESLFKRVGRQEKEIDRLQSTIKQLRSAIESSGKVERFTEL